MKLGLATAKAITVLRRGATFHDRAASFCINGERSLLDHPEEGWIDDGDEGVAWIRGHHAPDSKEVAAMLVAYALGSATP